MADDDVKDKQDAPSDDKAADEKGKQEDKAAVPSQDDWKQLTGNKFKSEAELAKAYTELEKTLGKNSDDIRQAREYAEVVNPILEEIRNDPEIFSQLEEKLKKRGKSQDKSQNADGDKSSSTAEEVKTVASDLILARFEEAHGINKLSSDEQKDIRKKIGDVIYQISGTSFNGIDLRRLNTVLENAYIIANKDNMVDKSKADGGDEDGAISSISSSQGKGDETLSPDEAKVAQKLGLTRQQYLAGRKK